MLSLNGREKRNVTHPITFEINYNSFKADSASLIGLSNINKYIYIYIDHEIELQNRKKEEIQVTSFFLVVNM